MVSLDLMLEFYIHYNVLIIIMLLTVLTFSGILLRRHLQTITQRVKKNRIPPNIANIST